MVDDPMVSIRASEVNQMLEALNLVASRIKDYERPMVLGGSKPSELLERGPILMLTTKLGEAKVGPRVAIGSAVTGANAETKET